jgi:hypothetical protein
MPQTQFPRALRSDAFDSVVSTNLIANGRLSPNTAKLAGFSQIDGLSLSWDDSEDETGLPAIKTQEVQHDQKGEEVEANLLPPVVLVRRIGLSGSRSTSGSQFADRPNSLRPTRSVLAMPPPALPHHRTSSPAVPAPQTTPSHEATPFPVRKVGVRRARVVMSSSEKDARSGGGQDASSPLIGARVGNSRAPLFNDPDSSPAVTRRLPTRSKGKGRVPKAQVQEYVTLFSSRSGRCEGES